MKKKLTVTIGISAYNEEKNIDFLLSSLLKQEQLNWKLHCIKVLSDGSTDSTVIKSKSIKSKYIRVIDDGFQRGKTHRVKELCASLDSDVLIILDADISLGSSHVIARLVEHFDRDLNTMVVGGNTRPLKPRTFFQRSVYATFLVFDKSRENIKDGNNIFGCNGQCFAIRKSFAKSIKFQNVINEDDFVYFSCVSRGYNFKYAKEAVVNYKLPLNLKDYLKQSFRSNPDAVIVNISKYFGPIVQAEYRRPLKLYVNALLRSFISFPLETIYISLITLFLKPWYRLISKNYKLSWYTANSTK
jgi:cellulose synthase/poly-beta-1,6-N-acetylglucosamine synthase-like glycosyltransferase